MAVTVPVFTIEPDCVICGALSVRLALFVLAPVMSNPAATLVKLAAPFEANDSEPTVFVGSVKVTAPPEVKVSVGD